MYVSAQQIGATTPTTTRILTRMASESVPDDIDEVKQIVFHTALV